MKRNAACRPALGSTYLTIGQDFFSIQEYITEQYNASLHSFQRQQHADEKPVVPPSLSEFVPAATMFYTDIQTLRGLMDPVDYGSGIEFAPGLVDAFFDTGIQIGLWLNGTVGCRDIVNDKLNDNLNALFAQLQVLRVPIFLRVGYEFDNQNFGYSSDPATYVQAFQRMVHHCEHQLGYRPCHDQIFFVWHSWAAPRVEGVRLDDFYPGNDVVDWIGISIFPQVYPWANDKESSFTHPFAGGNRSNLVEVLEFARHHDKPVMIAESTPFGGIHLEDLPNHPPFKQNTKDDDVVDIWELWFQPVLDLIDEYHDTIAMWSYINCNWDAQPMWRGIGFGDTRLSTSPHVMDMWRRHVLENPIFVHRLSCHDDEDGGAAFLTVRSAVTSPAMKADIHAGRTDQNLLKAVPTVGVVATPPAAVIGHVIPYLTIWILGFLFLLVLQVSRRRISPRHHRYQHNHEGDVEERPLVDSTTFSSVSSVTFSASNSDEYGSTT